MAKYETQEQKFDRKHGGPSLPLLRRPEHHAWGNVHDGSYMLLEHGQHPPDKTAGWKLLYSGPYSLVQSEMKAWAKGWRDCVNSPWNHSKLGHNESN